MSDGDGCAAAIGIITLCVILGFAGWKLWGFENGRNVGADDVRKEAVAKGHAEYVITNPATGAVEFRWKDEK